MRAAAAAMASVKSAYLAKVALVFALCAADLAVNVFADHAALPGAEWFTVYALIGCAGDGAGAKQPAAPN